MFRYKTTFVIGAGASAEADLPTGIKLARQIAQKMDIRRDGKSSGDYDLYEQFREAFRQAANQFLPAAWLIRDGMPLQRSIDNFVDIHRNDPRVNHYAKAAIVKTILEAERASNLYYPFKERDRGIDFSKIFDTWYVKFFQILFHDRSLGDLGSLFSNVGFIVFNYDRCFEHFLVHAVSRTYGRPLEEAAEIVRAVNIVHPYGTVGDLQVGGTGDGVAFGGEVNCVGQATKIKTYTEQLAEGTDTANIRQMLLDCESIIFLGFGFHKPNMTLIKPDQPIPFIPIYATAHGMSEEGERVTRNRLGAMVRGDSVGTIKIHKDLTCSQLFDYYAESFQA